MYRIVLMSIAIHSCYLGSKVVLSLLALELGAAQALIGVLAALYAVVPLFLGIYSGRLADTIGMRAPMLIGTAFTAAAMLCGFFWRDLAALFLVATLMGTGFVFFNVSAQNLAGGYGRPEQRARNFSILSIGYSVSAFIGPMFGGFSIDLAGHYWTFLYFSLFTLVPFTVLALYGHLTRVEVPQHPEQERRTLDLLGDPPLRRLILTSGLAVAASDLFAFYMPIFGHSIGLTASEIGLILGSYAAAAFLVRFALPALLRMMPTGKLMFTFMLAAGAGFLVLPALHNIYLLLLLAFVIGIGLGCGQPLLMMMSYEKSPAGRTGEVTGLRLTANNVARVIVPLVSGALGTALGAAPVFWMNAVNLAAVSWLARR